MMISDYGATARAIALQADIADGGVMTEDDLAKLDDKQLAERIKRATVFAWIIPEQKLRIVEQRKPLVASK